MFFTRITFLRLLNIKQKPILYPDVTSLALFSADTKCISKKKSNRTRAAEWKREK